jgi:hypothetical protein
MDGRRPFGNITNTLNRKRQLHEEAVIHDVDDGIFFISSFSK